MSAVKGDNDEHLGEENDSQEGEDGSEQDRERRPGVTDVLSSAAMTNAYYICHNVQDLMFFRGYNWNGQSKGTGKGKKKKCES